jgi:hypothetical protein
VRVALRDLGFSEREVEVDSPPAIALRNEIDVAHVELGLFTHRQLSVIHSFTERAEAAFKDMLDRLLARIERGEFDVAPYAEHDPRAEATA